MTQGLASAQPLLGFGQVRHTRLKPARHAFVYPTFFVMLPMRQLPHYQGPLAIDKPGAISFYQKDHGDGRSVESGGVLAWLDEVLSAQGIADALGEVWLHCYPRVLGYTFKPASFWYCHTTQGQLRAIVVEVNNTFGERHFYLLENPKYGVELQACKAFHVSPFCDVTGTYRFRFMRTPSAWSAPKSSSKHGAIEGLERTVVRIDHDDEAGPLLQTSISGTLYPVTKSILRKALWRYPAMTLAIMARIHWHAFLLWRKRLHFYRKPKPPVSTVTR